MASYGLRPCAVYWLAWPYTERILRTRCTSSKEDVMLLAHLVTGRYSRPQDGEPYTPVRASKGWLSRLFTRIFRAH